MNPVTCWESYCIKVYGETNLPKAQERECSRAFYAGMYSAFTEMLRIADSVSDEELASERVDGFRKAIKEAALETL